MRQSTRGGLALGLALVGLGLLGFNRTRVAGWTVSDLAFLVTAVVICLKLLSGRTADLAPPVMRKTSPAILVGTMVLVIAGTISSFQSFEPMTSVVMVLRIVWITLAWFWVLRAVSPNRRTLDRMLRGVRFTVVASCLGALAGYFGLVSLTPLNNENREAAFFNHPNELGGLLAVAMPFVVLGMLDGTASDTTRNARRVLFVVLVVTALGTTGSLTAFASTIAGVFTVVAVRALTGAGEPGRRRAKNPLPYFFGAVLLAAGVVWLSTSELPVVERFSQLGEGGEVSNSVGSREDLNAYVLGNFDRSLVVGVGLDTDTRFVTSEASVDRRASRIHNMYLKLLYEAGVPALIGLGLILVTAFRQVWRLIVHTRGTELYPLAVALLGSLVSANVFALFQPLFVQRYYWLPVALTGVLWALRRQEVREAAGLQPPTDRTALP